MSENIIADLDLWFISIAAGLGMAFVYDLLRLFRHLVPHGRVVTDAEDLLYWTVCFFASFTLLYYGNNGIIRFAAVLGAALGMVLYSVTIGRIFVKFSFFLINKTIGVLFRLLYKTYKRLHKIAHSVNRKNKRFLKNVGIFNKIQKIYANWLTDRGFANKININRNFIITERYDQVGHCENQERSSSHGKKRIRKKKNAGIPTRQK